MIFNNNLMIRTGRALLAVLLAVAMIPVNPAFAASGKTDDTKPVREVHNVVVGKKAYCFFVDHYVVLTPAETAGKTDSELTALILKKAGFYMKEANCKATAHKVIKADSWIKSGGSFSFSSEELESIRQAEPADGSPVKYSLDLLVSTETPKEKQDAGKDEPPQGEDGDEGGEQGEDPEESHEGEQGESSVPDDGGVQWYSTFKKTSPELFFVVVATESDAANGEEICELIIKEEHKKKASRKHRSEPAEEEGEPEEILPEFRTISMVDRSGGPIEPTLEDGTPVTLEWIDPKKHDGNSSRSIPAGALAAAAAVAVSAAAASYFVIKRRRRDED